MTTPKILLDTRYQILVRRRTKKKSPRIGTYKTSAPTTHQVVFGYCVAVIIVGTGDIAGTERAELCAADYWSETHCQSTFEPVVIRIRSFTGALLRDLYSKIAKLKWIFRIFSIFSAVKRSKESSRRQSFVRGSLCSVRGLLSAESIVSP